MAGLCYGRWLTRWKPTQEIKDRAPPRHSDYRDSLPEELQTVFEEYQPVVQDGAWTFGLLEMWFPKVKAAKHSVHIPCWDSFRWNPLRWRGVCLGRTCEQCYWTGLRQTRWARAVYAANLGREYVMPVIDISQRGGGYKSDIKALCWMYCILGTVLSCGIGQIISLCGNFFVNFAALYSCHAREKLRRKYKLPPMFGLPPGIDDCLVHFFCFYCASHQELRELAVRGVDGPGMHILDVLPNSWDHIEGHEKALAARQAVVGAMLQHPPKLFKPRVRAAVEEGPAADALAAAAAWEPAGATGLGPGRAGSLVVLRPSEALALEKEEKGQGDEEFGWAQYRPPMQQEMRKGASITPAMARAVLLPQPSMERPAPLQRAWSVAY